MSDSRSPHVNPKPEYVGTASGVLPGYTGYVPQAKHTHGTACAPSHVCLHAPALTHLLLARRIMAGISHYGSLAGGHHNLSGAGPQKGHGAVADRSVEVTKNVKSGYSGYVPVARDTFGAAHYGVGSHVSPDNYKKAAPTRHQQDMRLITGSDAGNSSYASDGGGGIYGADAYVATYTKA